MFNDCGADFVQWIRALGGLEAFVNEFLASSREETNSLDVEATERGGNILIRLVLALGKDARDGLSHQEGVSD